MSCIPESGCCCLFSPFSFCFLSNFQRLKIFITLFSGTVRPRRLKLNTHVDSGQMYSVYQNQAAALIHLFISSFFFLSNFQTLTYFITLFSGTVRPRRLKLCTHMDSGQMYRVYWNQYAALIHPFISSVFFLSNFQTLKSFVALFLGTVRPIKLKLDTQMDIRWMYPVYRNHYFLFVPYFFIFLSLQC